MSAWEDYKKKFGEVRPWDLLNKANYTDEEISEQRYAICVKCPELIDLTKQCKKCGCIMTMKTKLKNAVCPIGKW